MNKVGLIAVISIIFVVLFPSLNAKISCYTGFSMNIFDYVLESERDFKQACKSEVVEEATPPIIVDEEPTDPPDGYVPISYYDKEDVALQCTASNSYYNFSIPENAVPYSVGTKTITITNKKDWDMWMKVSSAQTNNHLKITSYPTDYKTFSSGSTISFKINWSWNPPEGYNGKKGGVTVYFNTACSEPVVTPPPPKEEKPQKPEMPVMTIVQETENSITVSWNDAKYAETYDIELVKSPTIHDVMYSGSNTSYTFTNLIPGTDYEFHLLAKNRVGESEWAVAYGKTQGKTTLPGIPSNFRISGTTNSTISLSWSDVDKATSYSLYRGDKLIYQGKGTSFTDTKLNLGTRYYYTLYAKNDYGFGEAAYVNGWTNGANLLPKMPKLYSKDITQTSATLHWDKIDNATTYEFETDDDNIYTGSGTSYTATGLTPGTWYRVWVRALNEYGESDWREHWFQTKEYRFDDEIDLTEQCTPRNIDKRFTLPTTIRRGDTGRYEIFIENKSNKPLQVKFDNFTKNGALFTKTNGIASPVTVTVDQSTRTIKPNSSVIITVDWAFPQSGDKSFEGKAGNIDVKLSTTCE